MRKMNKLAGLINELKDQLAICKRCGVCQAYCPLFAETGRESDVARGKLAILDGLVEKIFKDPEGVATRLNRCLLCGSCAANCPRGVHVVDIFIKARTILADFMGLGQIEKLILRGMLSYPKFFDFNTEWISSCQKLFFKQASEYHGTSCARLISPQLANRHFRPLALVPFHRMTKALNTPAGLSGIKVALFVGCLIDKIFPSVAISTVDVLKHHGVGIYMPEKQGCCGIPAISSGDAKTFNRLIVYNIEKFYAEDFDYLVTSCATCTFTIKKIWPLMFQGSDDIAAKVKKLSARTMDINKFLVSKVGITSPDSKNDDNTMVTYHDPCHLKKSLNVSSEPRMVIKANRNYNLIEMAESDWCCGMGGNFNLRHYATSSNIGKRKAGNIQSSGCSVVATGCPACMLQIYDALSHSGYKAVLKHPVEIYAESISTIRREYA